MFFFLIGVVSGFASSAPIGPINLWIIETVIQQRLNRIKYFVAGVILVDLLFAGIAIMGYYGIESRVASFSWLELIGGGVILVFGLVNLYNAYHQQDIGHPKAKEPELFKQTISSFFSGIALCISNPGFLAFWILVITMSHKYDDSPVDFFSAGSFLAGVFIGDALWFKTITSLTIKGIAISSSKIIERARLILAAIFILFGLSILMKSMSDLFFVGEKFWSFRI